MKAQEALTLGKALIAAAEAAIAEGREDVDVAAMGDAMVGDALAELKAAIENAEGKE